MAAIQTAPGCKTVLFEKMREPGRKLCITGKGRCNVTNVAEPEDFLSHFDQGKHFFKPAFYALDNQKLMDLFESWQVPLDVERGGRVFPRSDAARDILEALLHQVRKAGVVVETESRVISIQKKEYGFEIEVVQRGEKKTIIAWTVLIATGGASYPGTGSTGDGYLLAKSLGHTIVPIHPALVPLETEGDLAPRLQGVSLKNVEAHLWIDGKKKVSEFGEMLFTHFGLSGPIILTLSKPAVEALKKKQQVDLSIDLKPALSEKQLDARLLRDLNEHGKQLFKKILKELLPQKMIDVCAVETGISPDKPANQISAKERIRLLRWLKAVPFKVRGHRSLAEAIVTSGGVVLKEVDAKTMESRIVPGLFFAGEVLDLQADTGGYNLQAAFSTGYLAGLSMENQSGKQRE